MVEPKDELWTRSVVTVYDDKLEDFSQLVEDLLSAIREKDLDTLDYAVFLDKPTGEAILLEHYTSRGTQRARRHLRRRWRRCHVLLDPLGAMAVNSQSARLWLRHSRSCFVSHGVGYQARMRRSRSVFRSDSARVCTVGHVRTHRSGHMTPPQSAPRR